MARGGAGLVALAFTIVGRLLTAPLTDDMPVFAGRAAPPLAAGRTQRLQAQRGAAQSDRPVPPATMSRDLEWRFSEPQPDWKSALPIPGFRYSEPDAKPDAGLPIDTAVLERTADALRVTLSEGSRPARRSWAGGIYTDLPDWRREERTEVLVRARTTSTVHMMRVGLNIWEGVATAGQQSTFQVSGGVATLVRDGMVHTYRVVLDWGSEQTVPWRRVGFQFTALAPGSVDILSVRIVTASAAAPKGIVETMLEPRQMKTDFALFRSALEEGHPALYRYTTKPQLDAQFARAEAQLTRPMTLLQFRNVLAPLRAAIKDGAGIDSAANQGDEVSAIATSAKQFPLALRFESNRAFVLLNQSLDERVRPGMEVLAINGESLDSVLRRILPNVGQYGDVRTWPMYQLGISGGLFRSGLAGRTGFSEAYRWYIGNPGTFRTALRAPQTRQTVVVELAGVTRAEAAANATRNPANRGVLAGIEALRASSAAPSIRYLDNETTAVLVPSWGGNFPNFLKETFAALNRRGTKNLIIDVRGNTGGFDQYPPLLFSYLTSREFRSFERISMKTYQPSFMQYTAAVPINPVTDQYYGSAVGIWTPDPSGGWVMTEKYPIVGVQKPSADGFDGAVYVLIDGGAISATAEFCATVDFYRRATFIGEETGGAAEGDTGGGDINLTLPESHLRVRIPGEAYYSVASASNRRRGTRPMYEVSQTIDDLSQGRDTVLEFTRGLIRSGNGR